MMEFSRLSRCTFMPNGSTPIIATSAKPITARLMAISTIVNAATLRARPGPGAGAVTSSLAAFRFMGARLGDQLNFDAAVAGGRIDLDLVVNVAFQQRHAPPTI